MKKLEISLADFLKEVSGKLPVHKILAYLKEKGYRANSIKVGLLMKKLGFKTIRFYEQGKRTRGYELEKERVEELKEKVKKVSKGRSSRKGFKCYFHKPYWEGFYDLQADEKIIGNGSRIVKVNDPQNEKLCYCPVCNQGGHRAYYDPLLNVKGLKNRIVFKVSGHDFEGRWLGNPTGGYYGKGMLDWPDNLRGEW